MGKEENDVYLLINPFEDISKQGIFIFTISNKNHEKIEYYNELLTKDMIEINFC